MKQKKSDIGFFPMKPDGKLDLAFLCSNRKWPCLLAMVIEQSTEGLAVTDMDGNIQYINKAFATIHGYNPEELIGKHLSTFHTPDQLPAVRKSCEVLREKGSFSGEILHTRKDCSVFPSFMQNTLLHDEKGRAVGMIETIRDISARKKAEAKLVKYRDQLEKMVKEKTKALQDANQLLEEQKAVVERKNIALKEVLEELNREKEQIKKDVMANIENILIPTIQRIKISSGGDEKSGLELLERELKNLTSSFGRSINDRKLRLTHREIEICDMIRNGLTSKEIARVLRLSKKTVDSHRHRIRNKLGIKKKKYNLSSVLQHLQ